MAEDWRELAECRDVDPDVFHGRDEKLPMSRAEKELAKSICYLCPVQASCLEDALARQDYWGVSGGLSGPERARLAKERER